jgi:hypothetical protein
VRRSWAIKPSPATMQVAKRREEELGDQAQPGDDAGREAT